ncbi:Octopamine receptor beta-3R [Dufourea novaeangliae]|uniref:Octopamine receptor beta-3R n=1 Tax=Dufourea novaeangliae TaxID=178035 RepID=A0A154P6Z4_DUFNO|nr:Octopamine receptor beta-3R [Dufourea novaeangliae]
MIGIIVTALIGNALVIASVRRHRKLRVPTNRYVVSLAAADFLVAVCAMTFNASVELTGRWVFGRVMCDVWSSLDVYFSTASILHLCCISVDRYYAIVRPLEYAAIMRRITVTCMLGSAWLLPALISFIPIFMGWYTTDEHLQFLTENPEVCVFTVNRAYAVVSSSVSFWVPGLVMIVMYCKIYKEAVRQREALSRASSHTVLNSVHLHRSSTSRHHSRASHQLLLHPSDASDFGRPVSYRTAAELNVENAAIFETVTRLVWYDKSEIHPRGSGSKNMSLVTVSYASRNRSARWRTARWNCCQKFRSQGNLAFHGRIASRSSHERVQCRDYACHFSSFTDYILSTSYKENYVNILRSPKWCLSLKCVLLIHSTSSKLVDQIAKYYSPDDLTVRSITGVGSRSNCVCIHLNRACRTADGSFSHLDRLAHRLRENQGGEVGTSIRQQTKSWRAEHKAARTLGIIMGAFLLCWLPFFLWYLTTSLCGKACYCPDTVVSVLFWIGYFNSALNPLIYAYFNRDFREAFKDTLKSALPCCASCWKTPSQFV